MHHTVTRARRKTRQGTVSRGIHGGASLACARGVRAALVLVLLLPSTALAEAVATEADRLRALQWIEETTELLRGRPWAEAHAQITGGTAGEVAIGAGAGLENQGCQLVATGGDLRLRSDETVSATHWASSCPTSIRIYDDPAGITASLATIQVEHRFDLDARPARSASRLYLARPFTRESIRFAMIGLEGRFPADRLDLESLALTIDHDWIWQSPSEGAPTLRRDRLAVRVVIARLRVLGGVRDGATFETLGFEARGIEGETSASVWDFELAAGTLPFLDGRAWASAALWLTSADVYADGEMLRNEGSATGHLAAGLRLGDLDAEARYARRIEPTFDGAIAIEDRVSAGARFERARRRVELSAFLARTATLGRRIEVDTTLGLAAQLAWQADRHVTLGLDAEVARTPYAVFDGAGGRDPSVRLLLTTTLAVGR